MGAECDYLSVAEVAAELKVSTDTVQAWIRRGHRVRGQTVTLRAFKAGGCWRISRRAVVEFIACCTGGRIIELEADLRTIEEADRRAHRAATDFLDRELGRRKG